MSAPASARACRCSPRPQAAPPSPTWTATASSTLPSGIAVTGVGNCAPEVVAAVQEEVANNLTTNFATTVRQLRRSVQRSCRTYAGRLRQEERAGQLGAEAVENAIKIARKYTGRPAVVVMENAFHGRTNLTMAMTTKSMPYKQGLRRVRPRCLPRTVLLSAARRFRWDGAAAQRRPPPPDRAAGRLC